MTDWTETELSALRRAYASGTTRVSYDGKSVDYGSAEDLLARIRTIERAIAGVSRPLPVAGLAGFSREGKPLNTAMGEVRVKPPYLVDNNKIKSVLGVAPTALEEPVNAPQVSKHNSPADWTGQQCLHDPRLVPTGRKRSGPLAARDRCVLPRGYKRGS
ncbi:phage head-tail joining protein [Paracoccus albus]|uniref:phage head-tail joining protein n=1 Tax=Paracoccus albus TaxID=3017784 RepID=UPI00336A0E18